MILD
jgi:hypothetical protein